MATLLGWLDNPRPDRGIRQLGQHGWERSTYLDLARRANGTAHEINATGIGRNARIAVAVTDPVRFAEGFFGVLASGATAVPVAPPGVLGNGYPAYVAHLLRTAQVKAIVAADELRAPIVEAAAQAGLALPVLGRASAPHDDPLRIPPADVALVQFTSGSTSRPRAVVVPRAALETQLDLLRGWLRWGRDDSVASWLPLYHDMGLVGGFLSSIWSSADLWYMSPGQFVRDPLKFIRCIGENGISISPTPTFGCAHVVRRVRQEDLAGTDFSGLHAVIVGAERIAPQVLAAFARLLSGQGFRWDGLRPAYGLAEATLAVSGVDMGHIPKIIEIDWRGLRIGAPATSSDARVIDSFHSHSSSALVSCGRPMARTTVDVVDENGSPLPEGYLGEIVVTGPSVALGYEGDSPAADSTRFDGKRLFTGDAGLIVDGELYVIGRISDRINVRGQSVYVEQIEDTIAEAVGISPDRCAVVPGHHATGESVKAIIEDPKALVPAHDVIAVLTSFCGVDTPIKIYTVGAHKIPRTTSGKKRRRLLAQKILAGDFTARLLYDSSASLEPDALELGALFKSSN